MEYMYEWLLYLLYSVSINNKKEKQGGQILSSQEFGFFLRKNKEDFMLNVGQLNEGFVLDHIEAGKSMMIYNNLGLDKLDCCVAIIKNARSNKMGKKDIIKIEGGLDLVDLDVLGFIDHNITVNIIKDGQIVEKKALSLPTQITNVIKCKNPRCITSIEQELDHVFILTDDLKQVYRCKYCEEKYSR